MRRGRLFDSYIFSGGLVELFLLFSDRLQGGRNGGTGVVSALENSILRRPAPPTFFDCRFSSFLSHAINLDM